jgi:hypothetical protein
VRLDQLAATMMRHINVTRCWLLGRNDFWAQNYQRTVRRLGGNLPHRPRRASNAMGSGAARLPT